MPPYRPRRALRPLRARLPRRALAWYAAAAALTLLTAGLVHGSLRRATDAEAAYGRTAPVVVVTGEVGAGDVVDGEVAEVRRWPIVLVPGGAVDAVPDRASLVALSPGEVVLDRRLAGPGADGPAALLDRGERAVAVPVAVPGLPVEVGDRIDLVAGGVPGAGPVGDLPVTATPDVVATDAAVLAVTDETVVAALDAADAADVAAALTVGPLMVALRPPGG